jgi:hypothetical protein
MVRNVSRIQGAFENQCNIKRGCGLQSRLNHTPFKVGKRQRRVPRSPCCSVPAQVAGEAVLRAHEFARRIRECPPAADEPKQQTPRVRTCAPSDAPAMSILMPAWWMEPLEVFRTASVALARQSAQWSGPGQ